MILDLGEAERTFIYRCQDRFLAYSSLWGLRSVFFVLGDGQLDIYRDHVAVQRDRFERIRDCTGLFAANPLLEPLYVGCDIDRLSLFACNGFVEQWRKALPLAEILLNQISPTYSTLLSQLAALLRRHGLAVDWDLGRGAAMAGLARQCGDKSDCLAVMEAGAGFPEHVPTALITSAELRALANYDALASMYGARSGCRQGRPARLFVKATRNSGGNLAALVGEESFERERWRLYDVLTAEAAQDGPGLEQKIAELRGEVMDAPCLHPVGLREGQLRSYKLEQAGHRLHVAFLVQAEVRRREGDTAFAGIGLSYVIGSDGTIVPLGATGQVYRDHEHKHFQGAFLSDRVAAWISRRPFIAGCQRCASTTVTAATAGRSVSTREGIAKGGTG